METWRHRYLCDVFEDMRRCVKGLNFAPLFSLIEEAQTMGNRMETGLSQKQDLETWADEWEDEREKIKKLQREIKKLEEKKEKLEGEVADENSSGDS